MNSKLKKDFIEKMKNNLIQERQEIESELNKFADKGVGEDNYNTRHEEIGSDDEDNATEISEYIDKKALETELEGNLAKVTLALKKIENGEYGICEKCAELISEKRLEVFPAAKNCVKHF